MPSYLERDQLQTVSPYIEDTDAILRGFNTKLQYWGIGAGKLKTTYENYLGLELTREDNQKSLETFMKGAGEQMRKASSTDLSVGDNVNAALDIFKPLTSDESFKPLMGDHSLTTFYNNQYRIAEMYKTREGGKEYSDTNLRYVQQQHSAFKNAENPEVWKDYYANRREYTPYVDVTGKVQKLVKDFYDNEQFDATSIQRVDPNNPGYLITEEDKSTTQEKLKKYILENLSDKDRNQLGIEASVNLQDLKNTYGSDKVNISLRYYDQYRTNVLNNKNDLKNKLAAVTDKININSNIKLTDSQRIILEQNKKRMNSLINAIADIDKEIKSFEDPKTFQSFSNNLEANAKNMYINDYVSGLADANSRLSYNQKISQNAAYFSQLNYNLSEARLRNDIWKDNEQMKINWFNAESSRISAEKTNSKKNPDSLKNSDGSLTDPNSSLEVVGNDENVDQVDSNPFKALKDLQTDVDLKIKSNLQPLKERILFNAGVSDVKVWDDWFTQNKDKLSNLSVKDMPSNLKEALYKMVNNTQGVAITKSQMDEIDNYSALDVVGLPEGYAHQVLVDYMISGDKDKYAGLDMKPLMENQELYNAQKTRLRDIETTANKQGRDKYGYDFSLGNISPTKKSKLLNPGEKSILEWGTVGEDNDEFTIEQKKREKELLNSFPEIQRALVGQKIAIKLDTDNGQAIALQTGVNIANQIATLPEDLEGASTKIKSIYIVKPNGDIADAPGLDITGANDKMNPDARRLLMGVQWDADKNPITSINYTKQKNDGYWDMTVRTGTVDKPTLVRVQFKDTNNPMFQDKIADYIANTGLTYSIPVGSNGTKFQFGSSRNSNLNGSPMTYVANVTQLEPVYAKEDIHKKGPILGFQLVNSIEDIPNSTSLTVARQLIRNNLIEQNAFKAAYDAYKVANGANPTLQELLSEIKNKK